MPWFERRVAHTPWLVAQHQVLRLRLPPPRWERPRLVRRHVRHVVRAWPPPWPCPACTVRPRTQPSPTPAFAITLAIALARAPRPSRRRRPAGRSGWLRPPRRRAAAAAARRRRCVPCCRRRPPALGAGRVVRRSVEPALVVPNATHASRGAVRASHTTTDRWPGSPPRQARRRGRRHPRLGGTTHAGSAC